MKKDIFIIKNRIISILLTVALVISTIYAVPLKGGVNAATPEGVVDVASSYLDSFSMAADSGSATAVLSGDKLSYYQYNVDGPPELKEVTGVTHISLGPGITLIQEGTSSVTVTLNDGDLEINGTNSGTIEVGSGDVTINGTLNGTISRNNDEITINTGGKLYIPAGSTVSATEGKLVNYGTIEVDSSFSASDYGTMDNYGTITADIISLSGTSFTSHDSAYYYPSTSFSKGDFNLAGTVVPEENTRIINGTVGSFTISYGGATRTISGDVDEPAWYLVTPSIDVESFDDAVYYGTDYDEAVSEHISLPDDFNGTYGIAYYGDSDGMMSLDKASIGSSGRVYYRVITDATTNYVSGYSDTRSFYVEPFPDDDISLTLGGLKNDIYAQDSITITPTSGYQVSLYGMNDGYADVLELTEDDVYTDGYFNADIYFNAKRKSDGATTDAIFWSSRFDTDEVIFDHYDPVLSGSVLADGTAVDISGSEEIVADKVTFTIADEYLDSVKVNGTANTINEVDNGYNSVVIIDVPEGAAKLYTVVAEDKSGRSYTLTLNLKHTRKTTTATVEVPDTTEGEDYTPVVTTDSDGKDDATFLYKSRAVTDDNAYSSDKPTEPGTYMVRATIPQTDYYEEIVCEDSFTISEKEEEEEEEPDTEESTTEESDPEEPSTENPPEAQPKKDASITVKMNNQYYGVDYTPEVTTDSNGAITFMYKREGAADSTLSLVKPTDIGTYVVRAFVAETDTYKAGRDDAKFTISYLDNYPNRTYTLVGDKGYNNYYISEVHIVAPVGYEISTSLDGLYTGYVVYNDTISNIYLKRNVDGAKTSAITFNENLKVDTEGPSIGASIKDQDGNSVNLSGSYYADTVTFTISDEHLQSVLVNDEKVQISDNKATITIDSANGVQSFSVTADDEAGNTFSANVTIEATWRIEMLLPSGEIVPLTPGEAYKLGSGTWTTDKDPNTVYSGNQTVYVTGGGDYTFDTQ